MASISQSADLGHGKGFSNALFSRSEVDRKTGSGNGPDIKLALAQNFKRYSAKKWKLSEAEDQAVLDSQFLVVCGTVEKEGDYAGEITITALRDAHEDEIPSDLTPYLKPVHKDHQEHIARFDTLLALVQNTYLSQLLTLIFSKDKPYWSKFCLACAAEKMHHAYQGGLLHHTVEVAELCLQACEIMPDLNRDLLITGALLHDVGKLEELEHGLNAGAYTDTGTLSGHITAGVIMIRPFMKQKCIPGFPAKLKETVTHMILAHHGVREFGSPQPPAFTEAYVLSECDMISARVYQYQSAIRQNKSWLPGGDRIRLYTGDLGVAMTEKPNLSAQPVPTFVTQPNQKETVPSFATVRMPIKALVAAGSPEQGSIEEDGETREVVPPACGADYLVRVTGDSMTDEGIREQDLLFVKQIEAPKDGDIVVAHLGASGEVVKRFRYDPTKLIDAEKKWLESENSSKNYPDLPIDNDTRIRGKVVGLLRDF